jgi:hypothetical protein
MLSHTLKILKILGVKKKYITEYEAIFESIDDF